VLNFSDGEENKNLKFSISEIISTGLILFNSPSEFFYIWHLKVISLSNIFLIIKIIILIQKL